MEPEPQSPLVLVVDDDQELRQLVVRWLQLAGMRTEECSDAESFLKVLETSLPDAVCLDINLPGLNGLEALEAVHERHPDIPVLMLTGESSVASVVQAMNRGAFDYLTKPLERTKLVAAVTHAVRLERARVEVAQLKKVTETGSYAGVIGSSPAMREVFHQIERVAARDISVMVHGESGTGKELVARAIHENSRRAGGPFVAVNCAAIPESLQDSEFFGHERGAFTGANQARAGRFERADGGTLFLDEVAELSPGSQAKLLRVLQERSFERVGGHTLVHSDFRMVTATHRDLRKMVAEGKFREDLFFRLGVFELELPSLRDRAGDLRLLVPHLLDRIAAGAGTKPLKISDAAMRVLESYAFPGNVRELENVLQRAAVMLLGGTIEVGDLPAVVRMGSGSTAVRATPTTGAPEVPAAPELSPPSNAPREGAVDSMRAPAAGSTSYATLDDLPIDLDKLERWAIERALNSTDGQLTEAAMLLGIGRTTLYRKLARHGIR